MEKYRDRQIYRQNKIQADWHSYMHTYKQTDRQTDKNMSMLFCTWQFYTSSEVDISYDDQGYKLRMHAIKYISKGIFKMWLLNMINFDHLWPIMTIGVKIP